jgi:Ribbon-helix-helix protein, copG family
MMWSMKRTNIYLAEGQAAALDRIAQAEGVSRAKLIRGLIDRAIGGHPGADLASDLAAIDGSFGILAEQGEFSRSRDQRADYLGRLAEPLMFPELARPFQPWSRPAEVTGSSSTKVPCWEWCACGAGYSGEKTEIRSLAPRKLNCQPGVRTSAGNEPVGRFVRVRSSPERGQVRMSARPSALSATPSTGSRACHLRHRHGLLGSLA